MKKPNRLRLGFFYIDRQGAFRMGSGNFLNLGRYFAFVECLECRGALLRGEKKLVGFYERVFPFVVSTLNNEKDEEKIKSNEQAMWVYAAYQQISYAKSLKEKGCASAEAYLQFGETVRMIRHRHGYGNFASIKRLYNLILSLDDIPCSHAACVCDASPEGDSDDFIIEKEDIEALEYLLTHIVKNINLFATVAKAVQKKEARETNDPVPAKVLASLAIFTSHVGRGVCLHYDGKPQKASGEIKKSMDHLRRCIMDTYKLVIDYLNSHPDLFGKAYGVPSEFWKIAIQARQIEHDREDIKARIDQYERTRPFIDEFLGSSAMR